MAWTQLPSGLPVTRIRETATGAEDRYGNPVTAPVETVLDQLAAFDPGGSREPVEVGRTATVTTPKLYFIEPVDLTTTDSVRVNARTFTVEGVPAEWQDPFGTNVGGMVVELQEASG